MPLKKFKKDNLNRVMQKNWNKTLYPLYGGSVLDPIRRKVRISEIESDNEVIKIELIRNPLRNVLKLFNHEYDDHVNTNMYFCCGYFVFYNVLGRYDFKKNNAVFYDIYMLTSTIPHKDEYEFLLKYNNTNLKGKEKHYYSLKNKVIGFQTHTEYEWYIEYLK